MIWVLLVIAWAVLTVIGTLVWSKLSQRPQKTEESFSSEFSEDFQ